MPETKTKQPNKPRFLGNVRLGGDGMDADALGRLAAKNPTTFMQRCQDLIDKGELSWHKVRNLPRLFLALADVEVEGRMEIAGQTRAIMTSAFPLLTGGLTVAAINEAAAGVSTIGQDLVTDLDDPKKVTEIAGIVSRKPDKKRVDEGEDFPEISAGEERFEIRHKREGYKLSITAEMVEENDVPNIIQKINALGTIFAEETEEQTLKRVTDYDGSKSSPAEPYVLRPQGAGTSLFVTVNTTFTRLGSSGNRQTNNALVDTTDLENARTLLAAMKNSRGKRISIPLSRCTLLVPDALATTADKIQGSELEPGVENELNIWGPRGRHRPRLRSTPALDDLSTSAWYLGWFERQFIRKWKLRVEYVTLTNVTQRFLDARIAFQARVAWDVEIGARAYEYVIQNLSATTAPADE